MHLNDLYDKITELSEANEKETQSNNRLALEPAMIAGGRKSNLEYSEKKVKGVLDRVIVELEGKDSEICTKLAKKYKEIDTLEAKLKEMRDLFNLDAKEHILQYFNAEDEVLTRVVNTASLTLTLSKRVVNTTEFTDFEGFYKELLVLLPELKDKLEILKTTYTKIEKKETSPRLTVKIPEAMNEASDSFWSKVVQFGNQLLKVFTQWGKQYDTKLANLAKEFMIEESSSLIMNEAEDLGFYFKKNKKNGKIVKEPFRNANKMFLNHEEGELPAVSSMNDFFTPLTDEEKQKLIKIWNNRSIKNNGIWVYALTDTELLNEVVGEEDAETEKSKTPDYRDFQYDIKDVKEKTLLAHRALSKLIYIAQTEYHDEALAAKINDLLDNSEKIIEELNVIIFDLDEKINSKKSQPIKEELENSTDNMLALAKAIREYANNPKKNANKEDYISIMLFNKKRPLKSLSLFVFLEALQVVPKEQYDMIKDYVHRELK